MKMLHFQHLSLWILLVLSLFHSSAAIWCDEDNCYDLLGVNSTATTSEIRKAYYKLSLSLHPDKNPGDSEAQRRFAKVGAAYEILKDDDRRESYDYVLAHPEQVLYNTARYYQTYYGPKSDIRYIVLGVVLIISGFQYFNDYVLYNKALSDVKKSPAFKTRLNALKTERLGSKGKVRSKTKAAKNDEPTRELEDEVLKEVEFVGRKPPHWKRLLPWQLVMALVNLVKWAKWELEWAQKYRWKKEPYDAEAKAYLTRSALQIPAEIWGHMDADQQEDYMKEELWVSQKLEGFLASRRKEARRRR